ncbi:putative 3'-5' exonuclease related to the exonuclease domain of PolB [Anatilimnocola aggregata]|uniref:Putative 3'-5' exonuclease related to the exonuclease domain of PolB n=1 Tax=Anatilimnocola aggregata TaxID=2528021 RepID=A0A517Y758_9BACT|nr:3'-5' exonuclease [Anatilimnocola aggregata]QDU26073.1 putative 3'-5' exonuclease related to the exonuclease domain of PolB [Anatilimnocola aggregata]
MSKPAVKFLVFDIESAADGALVSKVRYPGEELSPTEAIQKYRAHLMEKYESDFIPYTFQIPVSVVVAKVAADYRLIDLVALDEPQYRSHIITQHFWRGWEAYRRPTLVSFNGRGFDVPLLELAAYRYGIGVPGWFNMQGKSYEQPRNRYNTEAHLDLHDVLTNFGAARFQGGLNLAATILGKPGKMDVQGHMVQDLFDAGKLAEITDYCRCDVLDTYFIFLRSAVMLGQLKLETEHQIVSETREWLEGHAATIPIFRQYLDAWGEWQNPWIETQTEAPAKSKAAPSTEGSSTEKTTSAATPTAEVAQ